MQGKDTVVHIQRTDGSWDILGQSVARGIQPEDPDLQVDDHGPKTASFNLRRSPGALWPDVRKYAKVLIQVAGLDVWGGRIADTPVRSSGDTVMSVQCEGAQAHLDDDVYERKYIVTDLSAWVDRRSNLATTLGSRAVCAAGQVANDGGLTLTFSKDYQPTLNDQVGVMLDMGPGQSAARIILDGTTSNNVNSNPQVVVAVYAGDDPSGAGSTQILGDSALTTLTASFSSWDANCSGRYLFIVLRFSQTGTLGADAWIKFSSIQVFADTAYESGDASTLTLDTIADDALDRASVLFDADRSLIATPADPFYIPEFSFSEPRSPRQAIEAGNAFQDMQYGVDHRWRVFLRDRPALTTAEVEIGAWSGSESEDQGDGDEIYSRCIVKATGPDGSPIRAERSQAQQAGVTFEALASPAATNPSYDTDVTTGVTLIGTATKTRDTSVYDSSPASLRLDDGAGNAPAYGSGLLLALTGTFVAGTTYVARIRVRSAGTVSNGRQMLGFLMGHVGGTIDYATRYDEGFTANTWQDILLAWTPTNTVSSSNQIWVIVNHSLYRFWIDSIQILAARPTIVEKAGFRRTKVIDASFMLTDPAAVRIADKYLAGHKTSPFKGRRTLTGPRAVRNSLTGQYEGLERLLLRYGQPLMDTSAIDPDTGLPGRAGRIATVSYKPATDTAVVELDNSRANFEALLERIGLVIGQGTR